MEESTLKASPPMGVFFTPICFILDHLVCLFLKVTASFDIRFILYKLKSLINLPNITYQSNFHLYLHLWIFLFLVKVIRFYNSREDLVKGATLKVAKPESTSSAYIVETNMFLL